MKNNHQLCRKVKYQALAELVICLVPIMVIFIGLIVVGFAGRERVKLLIDTRSSVEQGINSAFGRGESFKAVRTWDEGADQIPLSPDDIKQTDDDTDAFFFRDPLNQPYIVSPNVGNIPIHNALIRTQSPFFPSAANLLKAQKSANIFSTYNDDAIKATAEKIFYRKSTFSEEMYSPIIGDGLGY